MRASSLITVSFATPVILTVARTEFPSTRAEITAICRSIGRLFMRRVCTTAQALSSIISYPLKHVIPCKPSDWGLGMTVCIASLCGGEDCIIALSDRMLSMPAMSLDDLTAKFRAIGSRWMAMYAGNDVSPVVPIMKAVREVARQPSCQESLGQIVDSFRA